MQGQQASVAQTSTTIPLTCHYFLDLPSLCLGKGLFNEHLYSSLIFGPATFLYSLET